VDVDELAVVVSSDAVRRSVGLVGGDGGIVTYWVLFENLKLAA
jgi:hypothetical protein